MASAANITGSNQNNHSRFLSNKQRFFSALSKFENDLDSTFADNVDPILDFVVTRAQNRVHKYGKEKNHRFLETDKSLIEAEYKTLLAIIKKNDKEYWAIAKRREWLDKTQSDDAAQYAFLDAATKRNDLERQALNQSWLLCLYYANLLLIEAQGYDYDKDNQVQKCKDDIAYLCLSYQRFQPDPTMLGDWQEQLFNDLDKLADTAEHASRVRGWIGLTNAYRLSLIFSRLSLQTAIPMAQEMTWFQQLEKLGLHFNLERLNTTGNLFNVLSVGLFASRFLINAAIILKHTFAPTDEEKSLNGGLTASERFWNELKKRHWILVNDLVWSVINCLSNFAPYFNIAAPTANYLLACFLVFDALWLGWRLYLDEQTYFAQLEYFEDQESLLDQKITVLQMKTFLTQDEKLELSLLEGQLYTLRAQIVQLNHNRFGINSATLFNISAALLLMVGFSAATILSTPAIVPVCFFLCTLAVSMYLSADKFGAYMKERAVYQHDHAMQLVSASPDEMNAAWNTFVNSMVKNTVMPLVIMSLFAINWPTALTLTLIYMAYECGHGYINQPIADEGDDDEKSMSSLTSPANEQEDLTPLSDKEDSFVSVFRT